MRKMQAFKYELQPDGEQERDMRKISGACRFVFNKALAIQKENYEAGNKFIGYVAMAKQLTEWRNSAETPWLKEAPCHPLQHALKDLDRAYKNFFAKRTDFPRFKRKATGSGFRYPDPMQIKLDQANSRIFLPKLGWMRYRKSREIIGELRNVTVTQSGKKWFISIQKRMARKFSNNWKKAKAKVQKVHVDIGNARKDFLHKTTTTISKNHALVCVEDLQVKSLSKTAARTKEQPGKQVCQKSALNRSILDQGWGMFRSQLEYKLEWNGGMLLAVAPENTSRTCKVKKEDERFYQKTDE
jgi:putative transposase